MNFRFTKRTTLIFLGALVVAGVLGAAFDNQYLPLLLMVAVIYFLADAEKHKK